MPNVTIYLPDDLFKIIKKEKSQMIQKALRVFYNCPKEEE